MLQAILFDFNATLVRSPTWMDLEIRSLPRQAFDLLAGQGDIAPLSPADLARAEAVFRQARRTADVSLVETSHVDDLTAMGEALDLGRQVSAQRIEETVASLHKRCVPTAELIAGAAETLDGLQAMGYRLSIISNAAYSPFLTWTLAQFRILNLFEHVIVSADVRLRKPGLEIFRVTLDRMQLAPEQAAYVGDDFHKDVVASNEVGMRSIWYRPDHTPTHNGDEAIPDAVVAHLNQIPAWAANKFERL
jgi:HAD superfamily hydrolase (TIGR01509 family)